MSYHSHQSPDRRVVQSNQPPQRSSFHSNQNGAARSISFAPGTTFHEQDEPNIGSSQQTSSEYTHNHMNGGLRVNGTANPPHSTNGVSHAQMNGSTVAPHTHMNGTTVGPHSHMNGSAGGHHTHMNGSVNAHQYNGHGPQLSMNGSVSSHLHMNGHHPTSAMTQNANGIPKGTIPMDNLIGDLMKAPTQSSSTTMDTQLRKSKMKMRQM